MNAWRTTVTNVLVVTVVSVLLWLWAAGATEESRPVRFDVRVITADPERIQTEPTEAIPVNAVVRGARREVADAAERLSGKTFDLVVGSVGVPGTPGTHTINLADTLRRTSRVPLGRVGIKVDSPETLTITVSELETVTASIVPVLSNLSIVGEPIVDPLTAQLRLPKSLVPLLGASPRVEALLPPAEAGTIQAGRSHTRSIPLRLPDALAPHRRQVSIVPERAQVSFMVESRSASTTLARVPVQIAGPPADLDGYRIAIAPEDALLREVEVSGPTAAIEAIEQGQATVLAFVHLSATDLSQRIESSRIDLWMLPEGVTVTRIGDSTDVRPVIRLQVTARGRS